MGPGRRALSFKVPDDGLNLVSWIRKDHELDAPIYEPSSLLLLLRTAAVELQLDLENLEWESLAEMSCGSIIRFPTILLCTLVLDLVPIGPSFTAIDLCPGA